MDKGMIFYLGTHMPNFVEIVNIPWFVSVTRVIKRKTKLTGDWIIDSGGFTQVSKYGKYKISEHDYLKCVEFQPVKIAFCQDWMCEPVILKKTGLSVRDHQERTLENYLLLRSFSDKIRPVLQGWNSLDYVNHLKMYKKSNVSLNQLFGVGTICSRNGKKEIIEDILKSILTENKIPLHGFGVKSKTLAYCKNMLWSADSMAWSTWGRHEKICKSCNLKNCANCMEYALLWRKKLLNKMI